MSETIFRSMKGFLMGALFGVFLLGIFFELLIALPILLVLNRILGPKPYRMQWTIRILVSLWLFLLRGCGLLTARAVKREALRWTVRDRFQPPRSLRCALPDPGYPAHVRHGQAISGKKASPRPGLSLGGVCPLPRFRAEGPVPVPG